MSTKSNNIKKTVVKKTITKKSPDKEQSSQKPSDNKEEIQIKGRLNTKKPMSREDKLALIRLNENEAARKSIPRAQKLIELGLNGDLGQNDISDAVVEQLYSVYHKKMVKSGEIKKILIKEPKGEKLKESDPGYKITMAFLNGLFVVLNKQEIKHITEFKYVKRDDILLNDFSNVLEEHLPKIVLCFGKSKIQYSKRNIVDNYILVLIRTLITLCGYNFITYIQYTVVSKGAADNDNITLLLYSAEE